MNRRNLVTAVLLVVWGFFSVSAQSVETEQKGEAKTTTTTTTKKVIKPVSTTKQAATPATPAVPAKKGTPATVKNGATSAKPAVPASQSKPATTGKPAVKPTTPVKPASVAKDITGHWLTAQKATIVEFYKVGDKYNGKAVWSKQRDKDGKPLKDVNNPDRNKRNNPLLGTDLVTGLTYNAKTDTYEGGRIYQPQTGKSFNCKVKLDKNKNTMQITGGAGFISKTLTWTRTSGVPGK